MVLLFLIKNLYTNKLNHSIDLSTYTYEYENTFIRKKKLDKLLS